MITWRAAKVLRIKGHRLEMGGSADLVVLQDDDVYHAIWHHRPPLCVVKSGKLINAKEPSDILHFANESPGTGDSFLLH